MRLGQTRYITAPDRERILQSLSILGVLFGAIVRLVQYLSNRSLWEDEANLALNIVNRSYLELLQPLDDNQAAPPGFLFIEKFAIQTLGNSEYALRLFPLIAGIVSLILFYKLATRYSSTVAAPIAIALFACLKYTLYYASEVKQYSSDVMVALLLALLLIPLRQQVLNWKQQWGLGLLGAAFIWLSHPTVFVLAGIEIGYFLITTSKQRWRILLNRLPLYLTWLLSFAGLYWLTIRNTLSNETLTDSWNTRYPNSLLDVSWLFDAFGRFFYNPLGFLGITDGIAIVAFVIGCVAYYRRNRILLLVLTAPMIMTIVASYLEKYPFRERLVLFLVPFALLIIAEGVAFLLTQPRRYQPVLILGLFLLSAIVVPPVLQAGHLLVRPTQIEEIRPVVAYVKAHQQPGDQLYVYRSGINQFLYYAPQFGYAPDNYVLGENSLATGSRRNPELSEAGVKRFRREVRQLRRQGQRVWFVFCRASEVEEQAFLSVMEPIGQQLDRFRQPNAIVYLYRLQKQAK